MPDLADRTRRENDLSASLLAALVALRKSIDAGSPDWSAFSQSIQAALVASLADTFAAAADQLVGLHAGDNEKAAAFDATAGANTFAATLAAKIAADATANTQAATADASNTDVDRWFSKSRADLIAITETTRAISSGEDYAAAALAILLLKVATWYWQTEEDAAVCSICSPLNGEREPTAEQPAHPGCRCRKRYDFSAPLFGAAA